MELLPGLIKQNLIPIIGMIVYGLIVIGLTVLGGKVLQWTNLVRFDSEDSGYNGLAKGIVVVGLLISFSLIVAVNSYQSAPEVVMAQATDTVRPSGGGGCGTKKLKDKLAAKEGETVPAFPCGQPAAKP